MDQSLAKMCRSPSSGAIQRSGSEGPFVCPHEPFCYDLGIYLLKLYREEALGGKAS